MSGPRPTPTEVLKVRQSRLVEKRGNEPVDEVAVPTCPDFLDAEGRAEWKRLAPQLRKRRTISKVSRGVLAGLCQNWSLFLWASAKVNELKKASVAPLEMARYTGMANDAYKAYVRSVQEFGLTPASKAKVQASAEAKERGEGLRYFDGTALG